ncbi:DUF305 domain-containing protein [Knoellia locipacati]|uniref:DUF305 domain-containing protein n=1 Tax=Knoellia locipacati TaxID=882824 RepID=UPI00384ABD4D
MRLRVIVTVVVLALAASLSGCVIQRPDSSRDWDRGRSEMPMMPMMSMNLSEPTWLAEMIPHHEEAVRAAEELARSSRPEMRDLGAAIVSSQTAQIAQMRAWLDRWYPDEPEVTAYRPMMRDLSGLEGDALDRAFLDDMIGHHMMAVMMSQHLLSGRSTTHDEVADLARQISAEQRAEIRQMSSWLRAWFGQRAPGMMWGR